MTMAISVTLVQQPAGLLGKKNLKLALLLMYLGVNCLTDQKDCSTHQNCGIGPTFIIHLFKQMIKQQLPQRFFQNIFFFCFVFVISKTKRIISWTWFVPYSTLNIPYLQCHFPLVLQILARNASICCRAINHIDEQT